MSLEGLNPIIVIQKYKSKYNFIESEKVPGQDYKIQSSKLTDFIDKISFWDKIDIGKSEIDMPDGAPIPFILCSQMDLVVVDQEMNKTLSVEYNDDLKIQSQLRNSLTIKISAKIGSVFTSAIIGLLQWCWDNTKLYEYDISYFNDNFVIMKGHLGNFKCSKSNKEGWYNITITLDSGLTPKDKIKKEKKSNGNKIYKDKSSKIEVKEN